MLQRYRVDTRENHIIQGLNSNIILNISLSEYFFKSMKPTVLTRPMIQAFSSITPARDTLIKWYFQCIYMGVYLRAIQKGEV